MAKRKSVRPNFDGEGNNERRAAAGRGIKEEMGWMTPETSSTKIATWQLQGLVQELSVRTNSIGSVTIKSSNNLSTGLVFVGEITIRHS